MTYAELVERRIDCPYCGGAINVLIDTSIENQQYTEDCHICCAPIVLNIQLDAQNRQIEITAKQENA